MYSFHLKLYCGDCSFVGQTMTQIMLVVYENELFIICLCCVHYTQQPQPLRPTQWVTWSSFFQPTCAQLHQDPPGVPSPSHRHELIHETKHFLIDIRPNLKRQPCLSRSQKLPKLRCPKEATSKTASAASKSRDSHAAVLREVGLEDGDGAVFHHLAQGGHKNLGWG